MQCIQENCANFIQFFGQKCFSHRDWIDVHDIWYIFMYDAVPYVSFIQEMINRILN